MPDCLRRTTHSCGVPLFSDSRPPLYGSGLYPTRHTPQRHHAGNWASRPRTQASTTEFALRRKQPESCHSSFVHVQKCKSSTKSVGADTKSRKPCFAGSDRLASTCGRDCLGSHFHTDDVESAVMNRVAELPGDDLAAALGSSQDSVRRGCMQSHLEFRTLPHRSGKLACAMSAGVFDGSRLQGSSSKANIDSGRPAGR